MKNKNLVLFVLLFLLVEGELTSAVSPEESRRIYKPWSHGRLKVSKENRYLMNADGTPFFWLGDTGWLLPEKLNRDEAAYYLEHCRQAGFQCGAGTDYKWSSCHEFLWPVFHDRWFQF